MKMRFCAAVVLLGLTAPALAQPTLPFRPGLQTITTPSATDYLQVYGPNGLYAIIAASALGGTGTPTPTTLNVSSITRDSAGRVNGFTSSGTPYTVTYDAYGPATIAGGGKTTTVTRSAQGAVTGISTQ